MISTPFLTTPPYAVKGGAYGGLEMIVCDLAEVLAKKGHDVTVFAADGSKVEGCEVVEFGPAVMTPHVNWAKTEKQAYEVYKDKLEGFDVINAHNWYGYEYACKMDNPKLRVCHTHHGGHGGSLNWWRPRVNFKLNIISISQWMQDVYASQGLTSRFIYNGINLERYPFKKVKGDRLVFVGRFDPFKQPHVVIAIAKKLGLGLDLVGGSFVVYTKYMEQVKNQCDGKQIKLYLDAPHETKVALLQNAKCLLFPSKWGEPFGLVPCEAMACGTPVIALYDGAVPEVVQEGGFVCANVDAMADMVKHIDLIKPEACRRNARKFSREIMAARYEKIYEELLAGREW